MNLELYYQIIISVLSSISLIANLWVTYVYFSFKDLQKHHSTILSWISLFEISMSHHSISLILGSELMIKGYGSYYIIHVVSFFYISERSAMKISCAINQMLFSGAVAGVLCYNIFLSLDLIITLRNPLISGKSRMKYYHGIACIIIGMNMAYNITENMKYPECSMTAMDYLYQV